MNNQNIEQQQLKIFFYNACKCLDLKKMNDILNEKFIPKKEDFANFIFCIKKYIYSNNNYFIIEDKNQKIEKIIYAIDLFQLHGYQISKDDIIILLKDNIKVNNIPKEYFDDDNFKKNLKNICNRNLFFPYKEINNNDTLIQIIKNQKSYKMHSDHQGFENIKKFINENNIVPIYETLIEACKMDNYELVKYLINDKNIEPDFDCIIKSRPKESSSRFIAENLKQKYEKKEKIKKNKKEKN